MGDEMTVTKVAKTVTTIKVRTKHGLRTYTGETFSPIRLDIQDYGDRCRVVCTGRAQRRGSKVYPPSATFNVHGYPAYDKPPHWLRVVLEEHGVELTERN
jgi:hypothetical protein